MTRPQHPIDLLKARAIKSMTLLAGILAVAFVVAAVTQSVWAKVILIGIAIAFCAEGVFLGTVFGFQGKSGHDLGKKLLISQSFRLITALILFIVASQSNVINNSAAFFVLIAVFLCVRLINSVVLMAR